MNGQGHNKKSIFPRGTGEWSIAGAEHWEWWEESIRKTGIAGPLGRRALKYCRRSNRGGGCLETEERCHMQKDAMNKESLRFSLNLRLDPSLVSLTFLARFLARKL